MQVFTPQGKKIEVEVSPNETIDDVMAKVVAECGLEKDTMRFTIHGDRNIFQEPMKIYVRDSKGREFLLDRVEPLDTINDIKQRIESQENIPASDQYLLFGETPLNDDTKTLYDCGIKHKSTLDLEPMTIFIKTTKGDVYELIVNPTDSVGDIKQQILESKGIPLDEQILTAKGEPLIDESRKLSESGIRHRDTVDMNPYIIHVKDMTVRGKGKKFTFEFEPLNTIDDIKKKVEEVVGIPMIEQLLAFEGSMLEMNSKTLREGNIKHESTLQLEQMKIKIKTFQGHKFALNVEQNETVQSIKNRILEKKDISLKDQILIFDGNRLDDSKKTLADCGILHLDKLAVEEHMKVLVQDDTRDGGGKVYTFYTEETYPISMIVDMIASDVGIPMKTQLMSCNDSMITEGDIGVTLKDYGIQHKTTIHLVQMMITVKTFQGDTIPLDVEQTDTLKSIKDRILEMKGIKLKDQIVFFNDKRHDDTSMTLVDCGIKHKDTLIIEEHMKVHVQDDTKDGGGKQYTFYTEETYPISKIGDMIAEKVGIPQKTQLLSYKKSMISTGDMGKTLKDYGIKHQATIHLIQMMITVKTFQGDSVDLAVEQTDTLQSIKETILEMKGIPLKDQVLFFNDKRHDDTNMSLMSCGIQQLDTIIIEEHMKVNVQDDTRNGDGKVYSFYAEETYPISQIAEMIVYEVGIPRKLQLLSYEKAMISEGDMGRTLKDFGIKHQTTIHLVQMKIKMKTFQGDKFMLPVEQSDTVQSIKDRILEKKGIPSKDQILTFNDERLSDPSMTLVECGIVHMDRINVEEHMKVLVKDDTKNGGGKMYTFYAEESYPIIKIAEMIAKDVGIPQEKQLMSYKEAMIEEKDMNTTLKDYGIKHKTTILLVQMIINIKTFQGDTFALSVEPTFTLQSIKDRVEEMKGIPLKDQVLLFDDKRLNDLDMTLVDCGMEHMDTLTIDEHMKIIVKDDTNNGGGKTYTFYAEEKYPVGKIADMIADEVGIPKKKQLLSFEDSLILEEDMGKTLTEYGIKHKSTVHAIQMQIKIKTFQGDKFKMDVEQTDKIRDIMDRIMEMKDIPVKDQILLFNKKRLKKKADNTLADCGIQHLDRLVVEEHMKVIVQDDTKNGGGKQYTLYTEETFHISQIADMIAERVGILKENQLLSFEESLIGSDAMGKTLKGYGIKHKSAIHAIQMMINITTFQEDSFPLVVEKTDSLQSIKDRILELKGIQLIDQVLLFNDERLNNADMTLADCGIQHEDKLVVEEHMKVHVQDDTKKGNGKRYTFYTEEMFPISKITEMIADEIGIPKKKQLLSYNETLIFDEDLRRTLKDYGIKHQTTIYLVQMMITIKTFQGDTFMMTIDPSDKCQRIKQKVKDMKAIPMSDQILVFNDQRCTDKNSLKFTGIQHGDTVFIREAMKVNIQDDTRGANGKIYTFYMEETDTIHDVSMLIQAEVGIEKDKQRMTFEGESLIEENRTLEGYGIKNGDTILVKKSYIPVDWKKTVEDRYGKVKVTTYDVDYSMEGDGFIKGIKDEKYQEVRVTGHRKSQMEDLNDS